MNSCSQQCRYCARDTIDTSRHARWGFHGREVRAGRLNGTCFASSAEDVAVVISHFDEDLEWLPVRRRPRRWNASTPTHPHAHAPASTAAARECARLQHTLCCRHSLLFCITAQASLLAAALAGCWQSLHVIRCRRRPLFSRQRPMRHALALPPLLLLLLFSLPPPLASLHAPRARAQASE